jgi:hypothetical protein
VVALRARELQANRVMCYSVATRRMETLAEIGETP